MALLEARRKILNAIGRHIKFSLCYLHQHGREVIWRFIIGALLILDNLIRFLLFRLDPETSHHFVLRLLSRASKHRSLRRVLHRYGGAPTVSLPVTVMGLKFPNPVGLAAGFDKHGTAIPALAAMGFGSIEVGTVTPRPQPGNPRPRLFRLNEDLAIINRMGFNSVGLDQFMQNLGTSGRSVPLGVNLGKNVHTPLAKAAEDYLAGITRVYMVADYIAINVSSPNTPSLRELQNERSLATLLAAIKKRQSELSEKHDKYVPMALKIAPDLTEDELAQVVEKALQHRIDAVIATNTTVQRPESLCSPWKSQAGGLSGRPLKALATSLIARLYQKLGGEIPIIGVGGIETADDAWKKMIAGADLLQIYTSFIYQGPKVVGRILSGLHEKMHSKQTSDLSEAVHLARRGL